MVWVKSKASLSRVSSITTAKAGMQVLEIKSVILKYKYHNRTTCSGCSALVAAEVSSLHPWSTTCHLAEMIIEWLQPSAPGNLSSFGLGGCGATGGGGGGGGAPAAADKLNYFYRNYLRFSHHSLSAWLPQCLVPGPWPPLSADQYQGTPGSSPQDSAASIELWSEVWSWSRYRPPPSWRRPPVFGRSVPAERSGSVQWE